MIRTLPMPRIALAPRAAFVAAAVLLAVGAGLTTLGPADPRPASAPTTSLSQRLGPRTWALAMPVSWLSAPIPGVREDDVLDLLGARPSERATASEVATGLRVMTTDERTVVVELRAEDASAIASARARGLSLIPILRSTR